MGNTINEPLFARNSYTPSTGIEEAGFLRGLSGNKKAGTLGIKNVKLLAFTALIATFFLDYFYNNNPCVYLGERIIAQRSMACIDGYKLEGCRNEVYCYTQDSLIPDCFFGTCLCHACYNSFEPKAPLFLESWRKRMNERLERRNFIEKSIDNLAYVLLTKPLFYLGSNSTSFL
jgi:hypothetical protein